MFIIEVIAKVDTSNLSANSKMSFKISLITGCFVLIAVLSEKCTSAETIVPKLYEEIGCTEVKESTGPKR